VQDFSKFDAAELSGYVEAQGSSSFRASVKLSIVKNGAGTYEVAASDIAGDDVSGAPLVSFQMTGSLLEAKIDDGVASFSSAVIKFALISPPNSAGSLSIDASSVVSGTIDSGVLPAATDTAIGALLLDAESTSNSVIGIERGTFTDYVRGINATTNTVQGRYIKFGKLVYVRVKVTVSGYTGQTSNPYVLLPFNPYGLSNDTFLNIGICTNSSTAKYLGSYSSTSNLYWNTGSGSAVSIGNGTTVAAGFIEID
jgi:hypothetical protein